MTSTTTKTISKAAALVAGFALVAMSVAIAPAAHAQTTTTTTTSSSTASLQAQIASLQAQLAASQGTTMTATFTRSLTVGSTGSDVTALQTWLISKGYTIPAGATGYFGAQTKAAVAAYQAAKGITPAAGYFGPITMASVNASAGTTTTTTTTTVAGCAPGAAFSSTTGAACGSSTTTTSGSTTLSGGEGSINNFQSIGATTNTLGQSGSQQVLGFEFQAGGSDLLVNRIDYDIVNQNGTGTVRPWNVFQTATLTDASGNTIATLDASNQNNYSEDGTGNSTYGYNGDQIYRLRFDNLNEVVKEGTEATYYLTLSTQNVISSANNNAQYTVALTSQGLRATDALGLQQYSPSSATTATVTVQNTTTGTAVISTGSDNPQVATTMGNQSSPTNGVIMNTFTIQANGAPVELYTLPVSVTTATSSIVSNVVRDIKLYQGTTLLDTESPPSGGTTGPVQINFKNLNLVIPQGTTDSFSIQADINDIDGANVINGTSVTVSVPNTAGAYAPDIETTSGSAQVTVSGASTGNAQTFGTLGLSISPTPTTSATTVTNGQTTQQTGTFTFTFNVTAFGQAIYVSSTTNGYLVTLHDSTAATKQSASTTAITSGATRSPLGNYVVNNGQTESFTISANKTGGSGHFYYATLDGLVYGTTDANPLTASTTPPTTYTTTAISINS
jgi:peptidoglycan hydrolase-like protein with peptidoglycan-binding domain